MALLYGSQTDFTRLAIALFLATLGVSSLQYCDMAGFHKIVTDLSSQ